MPRLGHVTSGRHVETVHEVKLLIQQSLLQQCMWDPIHPRRTEGWYSPRGVQAPLRYSPTSPRSPVSAGVDAPWSLGESSGAEESELKAVEQRCHC